MTSLHQTPTPAITPEVSGSPEVREVMEEQEVREAQAGDPGDRNPLQKLTACSF